MLKFIVEQAVVTTCTVYVELDWTGPNLATTVLQHHVLVRLSEVVAERCGHNFADKNCQLMGES